MNAAFKLLESISKILLNQAYSLYDSEKSFDESLILNRLYVWKIIDSSSERPLDFHLDGKINWIIRKKYLALGIYHAFPNSLLLLDKYFSPFSYR